MQYRQQDFSTIQLQTNHRQDHKAVTSYQSCTLLQRSIAASAHRTAHRYLLTLHLPQCLTKTSLTSNDTTLLTARGFPSKNKASSFQSSINLLVPARLHRNFPAWFHRDSGIEDLIKSLLNFVGDWCWGRETEGSEEGEEEDERAHSFV